MEDITSWLGHSNAKPWGPLRILPEGTCQPSPIKSELAVEIKRTFHSRLVSWVRWRDTSERRQRIQSRWWGMRRAAGIRTGRRWEVGHWSVGGVHRGTEILLPCPSCPTSAPLQVRHAQGGLHLGSFGPSTEGKKRREKGIDYEPGTLLVFFKDDISYFPLSALPGNCY